MKYYFQIQKTRLYRFIRALDINPFLGIVLGTIIFYSLCTLIYFKTTSPGFVILDLAIVSILYYGHKDHFNFLKSHYSSSDYRRIRVVECILIAVPFIIFLCAIQNFTLALLLIIAAPLLSFFDTLPAFSKVIVTPFQHYPFEYTVGFRKYFIAIIGIYGILSISVYVSNFNLGAVCLLGLSACSAAYFGPLEHISYISVYNKLAKHFLAQKARVILRYYLLLTAPATLILLLVYPHKALLILGLLILGSLYTLLIMLAKYSAMPYPINIPQAILITLALVLPPFLLILIPYFYFKSISKLKPILE